MPTERVIHEYDSDDDVVVVGDGSGSSAGVILGIIVVLLILAAVWWFALGPGATPAGPIDININLPSAKPGNPAAS